MTSMNLAQSSQRNVLRPTVYICVEQKNREYDEKILLSAELSLQGYRCYVGTHAAIWALLRTKKNPSGIYFDKGTQLPKIMSWIKTKCEQLIIMDVELGPNVRDVDIMFSPMENYASSRLYPGSKKFIDKFLCVGPRVFKSASKAFENTETKVLMTGWPRADIWERVGVDLYVNEITKIQKQFGAFLLFASDFGLISDPGMHGDHLVGGGNDWDLRTNYNYFLKTISILKTWDADPLVPRIIVRPHISEDPRIWKKELGKTTKTLVVHTGDAMPWILASEGLINRGSTTAIQAVLSGKETYFVEEAAKVNSDEFTHQLSSWKVGIKSPPVSKFPHKNDSKMKSAQLKVLEKILFRPENGATSEIIDALKASITLLIPPHNRNVLLKSQLRISTIKRALGLLRHEMAWKLKLTNSASQLHYTPLGLGTFEIKRMLKTRREYNGLNVRRMTVNLWEVSL